MSEFLDGYLANRNKNDLDSLKEEELGLSVNQALDKNPTQMAEVYNLADKTKLPADYVQRNPTKAKAATIDYQKIQQDSPVLSRYLSNRANADFSYDDIENLSWWESSAREGKNIAGIGGAVPFSVSSAGYSLLGSVFQTADELAKIPFKPFVDDEFFTRNPTWVGQAGKKLLDISRGQRVAAEDLLPSPDETVLPSWGVSGIRSFALNAPMIGAAALARNPNLALYGMGAVTGGDAYLRADDAGLGQFDKLNYAATQASIEMVTEKIPVGRALEDFLGGAGFKKMLLRQIATEIPGEQAATFFQDLSDWASLNPEGTLKEFALARPEAAMETFLSTLVATGLQTSAMSGLQKAMKIEEQKTLDQIVEKTNESKVLDRSPEAFMKHIEELSDEYDTIDNIYIDAEEAKEFFQDMEQDDAYELIAGQIEEAVEVKGDIIIPMSEFVGKVVKSKNFEAMRPFVRLSPESPTQADIENPVLKIDSIIAEANKHVELKEEAVRIYTEVTDQLIETQRLTPQQAKINSELIVAQVTTTAANLDIPVSDVYEMMGLKIVGPKAEITGPTILDQSSYKEAEFAFIEARDHFLEVVPEDADQNEVMGELDRFTPEYRNLLKALEEDDWLGFDYPSQAINAVFSDEQDFYDLSGRTKRAIGRIVNSGIGKTLYQSYTPEDLDFFKDQGLITDEEATNLIADEDTRRAGQGIPGEQRSQTVAQSVYRGSESPYTPEDHQNLGVSTGHPSAALGVFFTSDQGDAARYGTVAEHQLTLENPKVFSVEEDIPHFATPEEYTQFRDELVSQGHDGITLDYSAVDGPTHYVAFGAESVDRKEFFQGAAKEDSEEFKKWAGTDQIVDSDDINDTDFSGKGPFVMRAYHGTTHEFTEFDASIKGTKEGQFGAVNYFTSNESDASDNYAGEGPDLTNRIERRAEELQQKIEDKFEEEGRQKIVDQLYRETRDLRIASAQVADMDDSDAAYEIAKALSKKELSSGQDQTMEVYIKTEKPFVVDEQEDSKNPWIEFIDIDALNTEAAEKVAEDNDITAKEVEDNRDDYEDAIDEARWEIEGDTENPLIEAIQLVAGRYDMDASDLFEQIMDIQTEGGTHSALEKILRSSESLVYAEDPDSGDLVGYHALGEIIQELGFDSIILKDANMRFNTMNISQGTAHIQVFDENNTNIKSVENKGVFDPADPNIYKQGPRGKILLLPEESIIQLTEASNLSTFLHESGHLFLAMQEKIYSHEKATPQIKADGDAILKFLGVDSFADIKTEQHEKFARGFEKYLGEGRAPSVELQSAFRRFAAWLKQVYTSLTKLNVELTPEIRGVMDRMLATDDQIKRAHGNFDPLFASAAEAQMTEPEYAAYTANSSPEAAKETLQAKMVKQLRREYTKWWKDEKAVVAKDVREELVKKPLYAAIAGMREGVTSKENKAQISEVESLESELKALGRKNLTTKQVIAQAGGINREDAKSQGIDPENFKQRFTSKGKPLFPAKGGLTMDGLAELMGEHGLEGDANAAIAWIESVLTKDEYIDQDVQAKADNLETEISNKSKEISGFGGNRLDRAEVEAHFFGKIPGRFIGLTSPNGMSSDEMAAAHGMASGSELLDSIATDPTLNQEVERVSHETMVERHGDILTDGTIEEQAQNAMRDQAHAKKLLAELRSLSRKTNTQAIDRESLREYARSTISAMAYTKIRPTQYRSAELRAAREAAVLKSKGDLKGAQRAKTQEIVQFYLGKEAAIAKDKAEKIRSSLKSIQSKKYDSTKIDTAYVNKAKLLIAAYDFRKSSQDAAELAGARLEAVRVWIQSQQENPENVATFVEAEVLGRVIPYKDMTIGDLQGLDDVVKSILHAARGRAEESKAEYRANIEDGKESIIDNRIDIHQVEADSNTPWARTKNLFEQATASMRKMESLARQADGMEDQGWVWRNTFKPLLDAANAALTRRNQAGIDMRAMFHDFNGAFNGMRGIKTFTTDAGQKIRLSYGGRLSLALNLGNEGNLDALMNMDAMPLTENDINQIVGTLSEADWGLIQNIWDYIDQYFPEIAELEKTRSGVAPAKVKARAFTTPSGKEMKGGYYPLAGDSAYDSRQMEQDIDTQASKMMNGGSASKSTKHGSTIERVGFGGKKIDFSINVLFNHVDGIIHDITHWQAVKDSDRVLKNKKISSELEQSLGLAGAQAMKQRLKEIAAGPQRIEGLGWVNRILRHARLAATYNALGYSARTAIINTLGLTTAAADMSGKQILAGTIEYWQSPKEMGEMILAKSDYMTERGAVLNRDIAYIRANLKGDNFYTKFKDQSFWMMTQTDKAITRPIWLAAYREGEMKFDTEREAIDHADRMVARTQGSGMDLDLANVETRNELMKSLTVMYTAFSAIYNIMVEQVKRRKAGQINSYELAARLSWLTVIPGILTALFTRSDDDELAEEMAWEIAGQGLGMIPIARDVASTLRYGSTFPSPIMQLGLAPFELGKQVSQGEADKAFVRALATTASIAHVPGGAQFTRTYGYLSDLQDGEIDEFSPIDLLITGRE